MTPILTRKRATPVEEVEEAAASTLPVAETQAWSGGSALATRAGTAVLWALLACGPLGLAVNASRELAASSYAPARELSQWRRKVVSHWPGVRVVHVEAAESHASDVARMLWRLRLAGWVGKAAGLAEPGALLHANAR